MQWLENKKNERRLWTAAATTALMGLVLGVVGVLPAFASFEDATCSYSVTDGYVTVNWSNVPDDMPIELLAKLANSGAEAVPTNTPGNIAGYGPQGSWTGLHYPGARTYWMVGFTTDTDEGGYRECTGSVPSPTPTSEAEVPTPETDPRPEETEQPTSTPEVTGDETPEETVTPESTEPPVEPTATTPQPEPSATEEPLEPAATEPPAEPSATEPPTSPPLATPTPEATPTPSPAHLKAKLWMFCDDLKLKVKVYNHGQSAGAAFVEIDGKVHGYDVAPGGWVRHFEAIEPGQTIRVVVHTGTVTLLDETVTSACEKPVPELAAQIIQDCDTTEIRVVVTNAGSAAGDAIVQIGDQEFPITVEPGEDEVVSAAIDPTTETTIVVTGEPDAEPIVLVTETQPPCTTPEPVLEAVASIDCATDSVVVTIANTGTGAGTADYEIAGTSGSITLEPGQAEDVVVALADGADAPVVVRLGETTVFEETIPSDCEVAPSVTASIFQDCANGELVITVTNSGAEGAFATVVVDGESQEIGIEAGATETLTRPLRADGLFDAEVRVGDEVIVSESGALDCVTSPPPDAELNVTFDIACSHGELRVDVANVGEAPETVVITMNGTTETVDIAPGSTHRGHLRLSEDQRYDVSVTDETGEVVGSTTGTFDCVQVLSDPPERRTPMELPRTGVESFTLAMAGAVLMLAGGLAVGASNARKRRFAEA